MRKARVAASLLIVLCTGLPAAAQDAKPSYAAGLFYDADPARLSIELDRYLAAAGRPGLGGGNVLALIAPHAGYPYSGPTAAFAWAGVKERAYDTVVVIGPSHAFGFAGCSIWPGGGFETPLGTVAVDGDLARAVAAASGFGFVPEAFAKEHSVEVQLPFIQKVLPGVKIVPVVMGYQTKATITALAGGLIKACAGKKVLVAASTDLSHYLPKSRAETVDAGTVELVRSLKIDALIRKVAAGENIMCGGGPVAAALIYAQKSGPVRVEILKRANSADTGGPDDRTVGYLAAAVISGDAPADAPFTLTGEEKMALLRLARSAVDAFLARREVVADGTGNPKFQTPRGVFVTLRKKGDLRGCIGFIEAVAPLGQAVVRAAIYAACEDPRFPPVRAEEVAVLNFEVSVLGPVREIRNPLSVEVGRHGLVIERGNRKGLLLPQVAVENGWDRQTFLEQACLKAGLPPDAWKAGARVSVFDALVFHE